MAIRKDLDDMLNNLKTKKRPEKPVRKTVPNKPKSHGSEPIDSMSVDDILISMNSQKNTSGKSDTIKKTAALPKKNAPKVEKKADEAPAKPRKKIVISGELPDYDAIRNLEREKDAQRKRAEEAEKNRIEAKKKKAAEEAERKRIEAKKKKAAEEAERKRIEAEKRAAEEAERKRIEAEKKAAEETERKRIEAEKKAAEETEKKLDNEVRISIEEIEDFSAFKDFIENDNTSEPDPVDSLIDTIREDAEKAVADIENGDVDSNQTDNKKYDGILDELSDTDLNSDYESNEYEIEGNDEDSENSHKISEVLENILDEDPDDIINERSEKVQPNKNKKPVKRKRKLKKSVYSFCGLIFAVLACFGLVTVIVKGITMLGNYTSGDSKKEELKKFLYPAVIMDIESFDSPSELSSDQIITAAIWSMIMSDTAVSGYEITFDVVNIPAADVEEYAIKLFGENLPELTHTTVGLVEARFYYNEETQSYNVPIAPVTYTYSPEIKAAKKSDNNYTVIVDYINELPEWLPKASSKTVEFKLTETSDGYIINSMRILSKSGNSI